MAVRRWDPAGPATGAIPQASLGILRRPCAEQMDSRARLSTLLTVRDSNRRSVRESRTTPRGIDSAAAQVQQVERASIEEIRPRIIRCGNPGMRGNDSRSVQVADPHVPGNFTQQVGDSVARANRLYLVRMESYESENAKERRSRSVRKTPDG